VVVTFVVVVVALVELVLLVVVVLVVVVLVVLDVVLPVPHGQLNATDCPTTWPRQTSASVAVAGRLPLGAQMQAGLQVARFMAALRM
jgi:hypothetical protein